jgi:hypothetical protein
MMTRRGYLYDVNMSVPTVVETKNHSSNVLAGVKKLVAMIVPIENRDSPRSIGILDGKATFKTHGNGKITEEELFFFFFICCSFSHFYDY